MDTISGEQLICCLCEIILDEGDRFFFPQLCLRVNGLNAHKICDICWWQNFALEGGNHPCPGCIKGIPIIADKYIYIVD